MSVILTSEEARTLWECLHSLATHEREDILGALMKNNVGKVSVGDLHDKILEGQEPDTDDHKPLILKKLKYQDELSYASLLEGLDDKQASIVVLACSELILEGKATQLFRITQKGAKVYECESFRDLPDNALKDEISILLKNPRSAP